MARIPFSMPGHLYGTAYGIVEVAGAVTSLAGSVFIGDLNDRARRVCLLLEECWCGHKKLNTLHAIDYEALAAWRRSTSEARQKYNDVDA